MAVTTGGWRLSSFTDGVQCVAVREAPDGDVEMMNSNRPFNGAMTLHRGVFGQIVKAIRAGDMDALAPTD